MVNFSCKQNTPEIESVVFFCATIISICSWHIHSHRSFEWQKREYRIFQIWRFCDNTRLLTSSHIFRNFKFILLVKIFGLSVTGCEFTSELEKMCLKIGHFFIEWVKKNLILFCTKNKSKKYTSNLFSNLFFWKTNKFGELDVQKWIRMLL